MWESWTAQGQRSPHVCTRHVNMLGLRAVHLVLKHFMPYLRVKDVLVRSDNIAAVSHINHQGSTRSAQMQHVTRDLLTWVAPCLASLRTMHLLGEQNGVADFLCCRKLHPGEWQLHLEVVLSIWDLFNRADIDFFASEATTHCPLWFSWMDRMPSHTSGQAFSYMLSHQSL